MDSSITQDVESKIFKYLFDIGCCYSCCLRHVGTRSSEYFFDPINTSINLKYMSIEDESINKDRCISCLGILCDDIEKEAVQKIRKAVKNGGYDSSTFTCALSLPVSLKIREMSIQIAIGKKFSLTENQRINLKLKTWNVKDVWKAQVLPLIEKECSMKFVSAPTPSLFSIDISFINNEDKDKYCKLLKKCDPDLSTAGNNKNPRNKIYSRNNIEKVLSTINEKHFVECFSIPADRPTETVKLEKVGCSHGNIFIGGRYTKLNRQLSQTPWFVNGEKKMETSVQDLLCGFIVEHTKAESLKFLSSGREDVDVRTINSGRPFAVELANPRITKISDEEFQTIVTKINASTTLVQITSNLKILNNSDLKKLKEGENQKTKFYRALCTVRSKNMKINLGVLSSIKNLKIVQKTPLRVLHRRPLASRSRIIHSMRGRLLTEEEIAQLSKNAPESLLQNLFVFDIKTQAGTYIKEFVHGDFGRTKPNLSDLLGQRIDIAALDVTGINLDWP